MASRLHVIPVVLTATLMGAACGVNGSWIARQTPSAPSAQVTLSFWNESVIGKRVDLPRFDLRGRSTAEARIRKVVAVGSCNSCSMNDLEVDQIGSWPLAVAVIWTGQAIPPDVMAARGAIRLYRASDVKLPGEFLLRSPQAGVIDSGGVVRSVPSTKQSLQSFLRSK